MLKCNNDNQLFIYFILS
uniref:Uncharacterized protein n=1 Tax=Anguilla anguilla TaxID=7936 RepID=A0A0E9T7F1_ANGAN